MKTYNKLNDISKPPFATFLKDGSNYLLSASPERYIYKQGEIVTSQPIKGTAKRSQDAKEDARLISQLENDDKERSENIMIVDLVRNDLSKTAIKGSVQVKELCKVYTFKQAHQMISTIQSKVDEIFYILNPLNVPVVGDEVTTSTGNATVVYTKFELGKLIIYANNKNGVSRELNNANYKNKIYGIRKYAGWYDDYLADDFAQWKMTFTQYKKARIKSERKARNTRNGK